MSLFFFFSILCRPPSSTLFPYTTLFRSERLVSGHRRAASIRFTRRRVGRSHGSLRHGEAPAFRKRFDDRSEEHTSELQSPYDLVCRLLLEKKKKRQTTPNRRNTTFSNT